MQLRGGEEEEIPVWEVNKTVLSPFSLGLGWLGGGQHNEGVFAWSLRLAHYSAQEKLADALQNNAVLGVP